MPRRSRNTTPLKAIDPTADKSYDPTAKVLGPNGEVASDVGKRRKELIDMMLDEIQNSLMNKVSGIGLGGTADVVGNKLYEMQTYGDSLRAAMAVLLRDYPAEDATDEIMAEMQELCDVLHEGIDRANAHVEEIKRFAEDVKGIQTELYHRMQTIRLEM